jgi:hypothetical protein
MTEWLHQFNDKVGRMSFLPEPEASNNNDDKLYLYTKNIQLDKLLSCP